MNSLASTIGAPIQTSPSALTPHTAATAVPRPAPWVLGGAAAVVLLVVAGWFAVLSPQATAAQDLRDQTAQVEANEAQLSAELAKLQQQFAGLPEYQAQLAALQVAMPADAALPELVRAVRDAAATSGVQLTSLVPSAPVAVTSAAATTDGTTTAAGTATTDGTTTATDASAAPAAASSDLLQVPVSIGATGGYAALEAFLSALQQQDRLLLVNAVSLAPGDSATASTGETPLALTITGAVFALPPTATAAGSAGTTTAPSTSTTTGASTTPSTTTSLN